MLQPKRAKYRKVSKKGRMKGNSGRGHQLSNGMFGIKSLDQDLLPLVKLKQLVLQLHVI